MNKLRKKLNGLCCLNPRHLNDLAKSCLVPEKAREAGYKSTRVIIGPNKYDCWEIQYRDPINSEYWHSRYRLDNPIETQGKARKYHQKYGTKVQPYFSQLKLDEEWKRDLDDPAIEGMLIEGEKKTDCLLANINRSVCAVGLSGVWNWSKGKKTLHDHIGQYLVKKDRKITVIVDSDYSSDTKIQQAIDTLCQKLLEKDCSVFLLVIPINKDNPENKLGLDDWLYQFPKDQRIEQLNVLLKSAKKVSKNASLFSEKPTVKKKVSKKKQFDSYGINDDQKKIADITFEFTQENKVRTYYRNNEEQVTIFNGKIWEDYSTLKLKQIIRKQFSLDGVPSMVTTAIQDIKSETFDEHLMWRQLGQEMVPLKNYVWDCLKDQEVRYEEGMMLKNHVQCTGYNVEFKTPIWDKVLMDMFKVDNARDTDCESLLHEIFGYCMTQRTTLKKAFFFVGGKNTGKSLLGKVITEIIGESYVSHTKLNNLSKDFGLASLPDKMLNIDDEPIVGERANLCPAIFKTLINPEAKIEINKKNREQFSTRLSCKFLVLANELPVIKDDAALDRLIFLKFDNSIPEENRDPRLIDKLRGEYPGIVAKSIKAFSEIAKRDYRFTVPKSSLKAFEQYCKESNPIDFWLGEVAEFTNDINDIVQSQEWFSCYEKTKEEYGLKDITVQKLTQELNALGVNISSRYHKPKGTNTRHSVGYRLLQ